MSFKGEPTLEDGPAHIHNMFSLVSDDNGYDMIYQRLPANELREKSSPLTLEEFKKCFSGWKHDGLNDPESRFKLVDGLQFGRLNFHTIWAYNPENDTTHAFSNYFDPS